MGQPRRKCRLAETEHKDIDLRNFEKEIIDTINSTVPNKDPKVYKDYFSTDVLNQSEAVAIGRALSKVENLKCYGKTVTIFRLFVGKTCEDENSDTTLRKSSKNNSSKPNVKKTGGRIR